MADAEEVFGDGSSSSDSSESSSEEEAQQQVLTAGTWSRSVWYIGVL